MSRFVRSLSRETSHSHSTCHREHSCPSQSPDGRSVVRQKVFPFQGSITIVIEREQLDGECAFFLSILSLSPCLFLCCFVHFIYGGLQIRENDFESALETYGVDALLFRVMRLCHQSIRYFLVSFRNSWRAHEIDRVRRKNQERGLTLRSAAILVGLCRLLDPPIVLPADKSVLDITLRGLKCCPWTSVLALRELGAFTDDDLIESALMVGSTVARS